MVPEHLPSLSTMSPAASCISSLPWRSTNACWPVPARKQRSWLSGLSATDSPAPAREIADLGLRVAAEREADPAQGVGRDAGQHVALVLARIDRRPDHRAVVVLLDPRVVAGGQPRRAEPAGQLDHRVEADEAVAAHARVRRGAARVAGEEVVDDVAAKAVAQIEREVRDAHPLRERRARRGRPAASSSSARRRPPGRTTARASPRRRPRRRRARAGRRRRCRPRRSSRPACVSGSPTARSRCRRRARPSRVRGAARRRSARRRACGSAPARPVPSRRPLARRARRSAPASPPPARRRRCRRPAPRRSPMPRSPSPRLGRPRRVREMRTRSPQAAPPAAPVCGASASAPAP